MANSNGRIYIDSTGTTPVGISIGDIQTVLGSAKNDIGALITAVDGNNKPLVNKWSKCKPIRYYNYDTSTQTKSPYFGPLTGDMWKGPNTENNAGVYYGIQIRMPDVNAATDTWTRMHTTDFEYLLPRGLAQKEVFRFLDFDGYDHNALPNPSATLGSNGSAVGYFNRSFGILGIQVAYSSPTGNPYGVDLSDVLLGDGDKTTVLKRTYPCILIDGYVTALDFSDIATPIPRPLYFNDAYVSGTWQVNTSKRIYGDTGTNPPWMAATSGLKATLLLIRSATANGICLDAAGTQDLASYWIRCSDAFVAAYAPTPLPGAVGVNLSLVQYTNGITVAVTSVTYDDTTGNIYIELGQSGTAVGDGSFSAVVAPVLINQGGTRFTAASQTVNGNASLPRVMMVSYTPVDFGIVHVPGIDETYDVEIGVVTTDGTVTNTATYQGTITLT